MSTAVPGTGAGGGATAGGAASGPSEDALRKMLRLKLHKITRREPLEATYGYMLQKPGDGRFASHSNNHGSNSSGGGSTTGGDKLYRRLGGDLRDRVEAFQQEGGESAVRKRGSERDDLEEAPLKAAFTLREAKKHEQEAMVAASLQLSLSKRRPLHPPTMPGMVVPTMDEATRRRKLDAMAGALQEKERKKRQKASKALLQAAKEKVASVAEAVASGKSLLNAASAASSAGTLGGTHSSSSNNNNNSGTGSESGGKKNSAPTLAAAEKLLRQKKEELLRQEHEKERQEEERERLLSIERARERERHRELSLQREEEDRRKTMEREKEEAKRKARLSETPQEALHRLYAPIFKFLWDMEFQNLHGTNPFRMVIDKETCGAMGVPDYCTIVKKPMNLTYIQQKVNDKSYVSLQEFFMDVELMINNATLYNADPKNEFHVAAEEMRKRYKKYAKRVLKSAQQAQGGTAGAGQKQSSK